MGFFLSFINYPKILGFLIFGVNWVVVSYRVKTSIYTSNPTTSSRLQECFNWDRVITILSFPSLHTGQTSLSVSSNWRRKPRQNMAWCVAYVLARLRVKWLQWRRHIAIWLLSGGNCAVHLLTSCGNFHVNDQHIYYIQSDQRLINFLEYGVCILGFLQQLIKGLFRILIKDYKNPSI